MKKILLYITALFISAVSLGQSGLYPTPYQSLGSIGVTVRDTAGLFIRGTLVIPVYADTTAANAAGYPKNYAASLIFTINDNQIKARNFTKTGWINIGGSGGSSTWQDVLTNGSDLTSNFYPNLNYKAFQISHAGEYSVTSNAHIGGTESHIVMDSLQMEINNRDATLHLENQKATLNGSGSYLVLNDDSVVIKNGAGLHLHFDNLSAGAGTKALRYNPSNGNVSYADTSSGGGGGSAWLLTGNAISSGNFFGSTNSQDVIFKVNNNPFLTGASSGQVKIGSGNSTAYFSNSGFVFEDSASGHTTDFRIKHPPSGTYGSGAVKAMLIDTGSGKMYYGSVGGGSAGQWTTSVLNIYNNNSGDVLIGDSTRDYAKIDVTQHSADNLAIYATNDTHSGGVIQAENTGANTDGDAITGVSIGGGGVNGYSQFGIGGRFISDGSGGLGLLVGSTYGNVAKFNYPGGTAMLIDSVGNVGIGTTTPSYPLDISATGVNTGYGLAQQRIASTSSEAGLLIANTGTGGGSVNMFVSNNSSGIGAGNFAIGNISKGRSEINIDLENGVQTYGQSDNNNSKLTLNNSNKTLDWNSNDSYFNFNGDTRLFQVGDWTYDWYNTHTSWDDDYGARTITSYADGGQYFIGAGNVGIGTNSPTHKFEVQNGNAYFQAPALTDAFRINSTSLETDVVRVDDVNHLLLFDENNAGYKVGIGTTTPTQKLEINGNIQAGQVYSTYFGTITSDDVTLGVNTTGYQKLFHDEAGYLQLGDIDNNVYGLKLTVRDASNLVSIDNGAHNVNVGINTSTPLATLDVHGSIKTGLAINGDADYTVLTTDNIINFNSTLSGLRKVFLPDISTVGDGFHVTVKSDNAVNGVNFIDVGVAGGATIDGSTDYNITTSYGSVTLVSDVADNHWIVIATVL